MSTGSAFDTIKEQVRGAIDIVDLVGGYIPLRREGRGYKGICPWHDDRRPSLQVNPDRQIFRCFVCNIGGDIFSFVERIEGVSFREALTMLAERAGISLPTSSGGSGVAADEKRLLYQAMAWAEQQYHDCLLNSREGQVALRYLEGRRITPQSIRQFRLGFSPARWDWILDRARDTRFSPKVLESVGLVCPRSQGGGHYDRFRNRVLFSIHDTQGRPVALGGRILPDAPADAGAKYINSPETPLFSKSNLLYGLDVAKDAISKSRAVMVMEGYTDCLIAQQHGFSNAVAVLGTALGERQIRILRRFADRIILVLDGDEAGRKRTDQLLELFVAEPVDLRILTLPDQLDPADFLLERGPEAMAELVTAAVDALEHKFRAATGLLSASSGTHAANQALEEVLATLAKTPRAEGGTAAALKMDQLLNRLSVKFGIAEERLRSRLANLRRGRRPSSAAERGGPAGQKVADQEVAPQETEQKIDKAARYLLEILMQAPELLPVARAELSPEELNCPRLRAIYLKCCQLDDSGVLASFDRLLLEIEDSELKSLLVEIDEARRAKNRLDPPAELGELLLAFRDHREEGRNRRLEHKAEESASEEEALDILRHIIERKRHRQGISVPTDG